MDSKLQGHFLSTIFSLYLCDDSFFISLLISFLKLLKLLESPAMAPCQSDKPVAFHGFSGSSAGKESTYSAGDSGSIPVSARSPGEGIGYLFQYAWVSLLAQMVMNPPALWETWVQSLGWEDALEKGKVTHSSILAWRIPWTEEPGRLVHWVTKSRTQLSNFHFQHKEIKFTSNY